MMKLPITKLVFES